MMPATRLTLRIRAAEVRAVAALRAIYAHHVAQASARRHRSADRRRDGGPLVAVGYKAGRWVDVVIIQRALAGDTQPPAS